MTLHADAEVIGTQNDLAFPAAAPIAARADGRPACTRGLDVPLGGTAFSFLPARCTTGVDCTAVRALVLSLATPGLPDGTVMYSCDLAVTAGTPPGTYALTITNVGGADADGLPVPVDGIDGAVIVEVPTPTPTLTPILPTRTPIPPTPVATQTSTATFTATIADGRDTDGGSCAIVERSGGAWLLLLPLLVLFRRTRSPL